MMSSILKSFKLKDQLMNENLMKNNLIEKSRSWPNLKPSVYDSKPSKSYSSESDISQHSVGSRVIISPNSEVYEQRLESIIQVDNNFQYQSPNTNIGVLSASTPIRSEHQNYQRRLSLNSNYLSTAKNETSNIGIMGYEIMEAKSRFTVK